MTTAHHRFQQQTRDGLQTRFVEFRWDGERTVSGVVLRYGDIAELPWGERETFLPGSFGDIQSADVILNMQHDRRKPMCRTGGSGLVLEDDGQQLTLRAELPDTTVGNDALELVRTRVLRGFSVEFLPVKWDTEKDEDGMPIPDGLITIEKAKLRGVGLVDRPAYEDSRVNPRERDSMDEQRIQEIVEGILAQRSDDQQVDAGQIATAVATALTESVTSQVQEQVREQVAAAIQERDDAQAAAEEAEEQARQAEQDAQAAQEQLEQDAEDRAELLVLVRDLLPEDTEVRGQSNHDLLVLAVGDEVSGAADRSEDYLLAKVEAIIERREAAAQGLPRIQGRSTPNPTRATGGGSVPAGVNPLNNVLGLPGRPSPGSTRGGDRATA